MSFKMGDSRNERKHRAKIRLKAEFSDELNELGAIDMLNTSNPKQVKGILKKLARGMFRMREIVED